MTLIGYYLISTGCGALAGKRNSSMGPPGGGDLMTRHGHSTTELHPAPPSHPFPAINESLGFFV